ncbi:MAG TPA: ATP-binding protein [Micromonosporaceae bacterium]|nr:ATP-binding protein [Micromonosporaceae bacterium]
MTTLPTPTRWAFRAWVGLGVGAAGLAALTAALVPARAGTLTLTSIALLYLIPVVIAAGIGGTWVGLAAAIASDLLLNWFFVPPYHTLAVDRRDNLVALLVYVLVAVAVAVAVDLAARQRAAAARSGVEAQLLGRISAAPVEGDSVPRLLGYVRDTFAMRTVALLERGDDGAEHVVASVGPDVDTSSARLSAPAGEGRRLIAVGPELFGEDRRLLVRLAAAAAGTLEASRRAAQAAELAEVDRVRTAILAAVGHDLRTPLASIKAAASSLRAPDVAFSDEDRAELVATIDESADRLDDLVENLLAMSRLQAGVLSVHPSPVALDAVVAHALRHVPTDADVTVAVGDDLPYVMVDPGLLERVVANLVSNAVKAAAGRPVTVRAARSGTTVQLSVIDHGTGIRTADRERLFQPFQRLDDRRADGGLGLGLAIARGFTEAMGGALAPSDTSGGGLTMTVTLPLASGHDDGGAP